MNFGNETTEILVQLVLPSLPVKCPKCMLGGVPEMETNCGNGIAESGRNFFFFVATKLLKMKRKKKDVTSTTFFTTNYKWLVIIGSNLNLTLKLLFFPNNNN